MGSIAVRRSDGRPSPVAVILVEPELLASSLAYLLRAHGWRVQHCDVAGVGDHVDAVIRSGEATALEPDPDAAITIVLPDSVDGRVVVRHCNGAGQLLASGEKRLEGIFEVLGAGT